MEGKEKKCIALIIPNGWGIKAFLLNDFYKYLSENAKVLVFSPLGRNKKFQERFNKSSVKFFHLDMAKLNSIQNILFTILTYSQYYRKPTYLNQSYLKMYPSNRIKGRIIFFFEKLIARYIGKYISQEAQIFFEKLFLPFRKEIKRLKKIYMEENVELVFSTVPLIAYFEHPALFAAKEIGIKTSCIITSWDNLASKGRLPIKFDHYFCWSDKMKDELMEWYPFIKEENITVSGPPQFDFYFKKDFIIDKELFFKRIGADLNKPIILWAAASTNQYPNEDKIFENFYNEVKRGALKKNFQVVLRAHPIGGLKRFKNILEKYNGIIGMETNSDDPDFLLKWFPDLDDIKDLVNIIYYSDVIINHCSTFTLDSCAMGKPVINLAYDLEKNSKLEKYVINCYKYDHYLCVLDLNAVKVAYSQDELISFINHYLDNPKSDEKGREKLFNLQVKDREGKSSLLIAKKLIEILS